MLSCLVTSTLHLVDVVVVVLVFLAKVMETTQVHQLPCSMGRWFTKEELLHRLGFSSRAWHHQLLRILASVPSSILQWSSKGVPHGSTKGAPEKINNWVALNLFQFGVENG